MELLFLLSMYVQKLLLNVISTRQMQVLQFAFLSGRHQTLQFVWMVVSVTLGPKLRPSVDWMILAIVVFLMENLHSYPIYKGNM